MLIFGHKSIFIMKQKNFHVSIKTIDDKPLFPPGFDGDKLLFPFVMQAALKLKSLPVGFAGFPTGVEVVIKCNTQKDAKAFADALSALLYQHNNSIGYVIESFGIHIGELTQDERTLHAFMSDMMMRSMAARGALDEMAQLAAGSAGGESGEVDEQGGESAGQLFSVDIDLNDLDNVQIKPLGRRPKRGKRYS